MNHSSSLQNLAYRRALAIKYQLGALRSLLSFATEVNESDYRAGPALFGAADIVYGIQMQADDLMNALDSSPDLMSYVVELTGHPVDQCMPSLAAIAKEAMEKRSAAAASEAPPSKTK